MIVSINSDRNTMNIVVGNFYVVGHKDADKKHGFIIKNSDGYSSYANESIENRNLLKQLDKLKIERLLKIIPIYLAVA